MFEQSFDKDIMNVTHELYQPSHQRSGIEIGLHQPRYRQFELVGTEKVGENEGRLLNFLDFTSQDHRAIQL